MYCVFMYQILPITELMREAFGVYFRQIFYRRKDVVARFLYLRVFFPCRNTNPIY